MENSEIQTGDKNKQLEFLRNIWKSADSKSEAVTTESNTTDKCNIDLNSRKANRRNRYMFPQSAESLLSFTESEDDDFLENNEYVTNEKSISFAFNTHAGVEDVDDDDVIHNNFFVKQEKHHGGRVPQRGLYANSVPTSLIVFLDSEQSKSGVRKGSDEENPLQEEAGSDEESAITEMSKSGSKDTSSRSMFMLSVSYRHGACRSMDDADFPKVLYRKPPRMKYGIDDEFSDDANDDTNEDSNHYQTHCHHQHQHCHHNHQGHHIVCRTHGSLGREEERNEKYPFDYCDDERKPPKSWRTCDRYSSYGCGQCRNCKTGNMVSTMEQLTESIDCEIHDVVPDGNCLFRSVVDQLRMNGEFHWTARTIRHLAVEYLHKNPSHEDGSHLGMFLTTETWDEYLSRMSRDKEWGDQLILRGISNVLERTLSIISAIGSGHNQTTIEPSIPSDDITKKEPLQLGHFDEQHYVSLRKKTWSDTWFEHGRRVNNVLVKDWAEFESEVKSDNMDAYFGSATDLFTSVPFIHLHFLINKAIPIGAFYNEKPNLTTKINGDSSERSSKSYRSETVGNMEEELDSNLSFLPKFGISYNKRDRPSMCITVMGISTDGVVLNDIQETSQVENHFCLDIENMPPALTKLVVIKPGLYASSFIKFRDGTAYLSAKYLLQFSSTKNGLKFIPGIECLKWPANILNSWLERERPACWPTKDIITKASEEKCIVVPCESSDNLTWRFNFMLPIRVLVKEGTTHHQRHCYRVFKLLIDSASTENINLPSYGVKSVFLYAMERIPLSCWTSNKGGCLLYLLDRLLFSIHRKQMPDYFIPSWNLLEDTAEEECKNLYSRILAIRQFPVTSIVLATEKRGLPGSCIAEPLIDHLESIKSGHYIEGSENDVFLQINIEDVKNKLWNCLFRDAADAFVELYEEFLRQNNGGPPMEEFAPSFLQDLPNSMQWWFYFFLDHFIGTRALKIIMGAFGGTPIGDLLGPNRKNGKFDDVRIPAPLLQEEKAHSTSQETDVAFLMDLSLKLLFTREYDHCSHYTIEFIRLLKEKIKAIADFSQGQHEQTLYQTNYQGQMMTLQYYVAMMFSLRRLFTCLKELGNIDIFSEYIEDAENACALIGTFDNYYYLAQFYKGLGCTEKYREAMRTYNGGSSDDVTNV